MPNNEYANEPNQSRSEDIIQSILDNTEYDEEARSRIEYLLIELKNAIEGGGGGGGVTSYAPLTEKPKIDNHTLQAGNNTSSDLGLQTKLTFDSAPTESSTNPVTSGGIYTALDSKANSSDVYNKSDVDTALTAKADKSTTYTKSEVDTALSSKQNVISDLSTIRSGAALGATAVQPVSGKGLSTNDYTTTEKTKLAGIAEGAEVNEIDGIKVNNTTINPDANKTVNITVPPEISETNKLNPAYINYDSTHRAVSDAEKSTWNGKQNALSSTQLSAVNSGITSADVEQIATNKNNISKDEAALVELVDGGAKNKLNTIAESTTISGITITVNSDYSITLNGTANDLLSIKVGQASLENGSYVLSGCPIDGNLTTNYALQLLIYKSITVGPLTFAEPYLKPDSSDKFILKNSVVIDTNLYDIVKNGYVYYTGEGEPPKELTLENVDATLGIKVAGKAQATYSPKLTDAGNGVYIRPYVTVKDKTTNIETTTYIDTQYISAVDFAACQDVGDTTTIAFTGDETYEVQIAIEANCSVSDLTFYPMICTKTAWDISQAYQPYRPSYQELYEMVKALQANQ